MTHEQRSPQASETGLQLISLGVGDAFSARHYSTCLALRHVPSGNWLLLDCPHPIHKVLAEAVAAAGVELPLEQLVGTVITHLHADHASGLEGLGYYMRYRLRDPYQPVPPDELPVLIAGPRVAETLAQAEEARGPGKAIFQVRTLEPGKLLELGEFRLESRPTRHGGMPCYAFRVSHAGTHRRLGHSADTALDPDLIDWLAPTDFIVHEIGSPIPATANHTEHGELADYLASRPDHQELRAKVHLAHYGDGFDADQARLPLLRQGWKYAV